MILYWYKKRLSEKQFAQLLRIICWVLSLWVWESTQISGNSNDLRKLSSQEDSIRSVTNLVYDGWSNRTSGGARRSRIFLLAAVFLFRGGREYITRGWCRVLSVIHPSSCSSAFLIRCRQPMQRPNMYPISVVGAVVVCCAVLIGVVAGPVPKGELSAEFNPDFGIF